MLDEWKALKPGKDAEEDYLVHPLIDLLATCNRVDAIEALAERFPALSVRLKTKILDVFEERFVDRISRPEDTPRTAECEAAAEALLIRALEDRTVYENYSVGRNDFSYHDPRVCDTALINLSRLWPARYPLVWSILPFERDRQVRAARNIWRSAHGEPALPPLPRPTHPAAAANPNVVAELTWRGGEPLPDCEIAVASPVTAEQFARTVQRLRHELPENCAGFEIVVQRPADGQGALVQIEWLPGARFGEKWWQARTDFGSGAKSEGNNGGHATEYGYRFPEARERKAIEAALGAPAEQPVLLRYRGGFSER